MPHIRLQRDMCPKQVCPPTTIVMWDYSGETPKVAQKLTMKHESVSAACLTADVSSSQFLLVGTEKGNIFFFRAEDFSRSSVDIMWNKVRGLNEGLVRQPPHTHKVDIGRYAAKTTSVLGLSPHLRNIQQTPRSF